MRTDGLRSRKRQPAPEPETTKKHLSEFGRPAMLMGSVLEEAQTYVRRHGHMQPLDEGDLFLITVAALHPEELTEAGNPGFGKVFLELFQRDPELVAHMTMKVRTWNREVTPIEEFLYCGWVALSESQRASFSRLTDAELAAKIEERYPEVKARSRLDGGGLRLLEAVKKARQRLAQRPARPGWKPRLAPPTPAQREQNEIVQLIARKVAKMGGTVVSVKDSFHH